MEAAHIRWKPRGGDCCETNGLALCPTHHYTLDRGLWSLDHNDEITDYYIYPKSLHIKHIEPDNLTQRAYGHS